MDQWGSCKAAIHYINLFLTQVDQVSWVKDPVVNKMFCYRLKGEAFGLRAMFNFYMLQAHAGYTEDGRLMKSVMWSKLFLMKTEKPGHPVTAPSRIMEKL